jgi:hypothetical protein
MKKLFIVLILSALLTPAFSQDEKGPDPVTNTFGTAVLIDNQTTETPRKGGLELQIQHRFSLIESIDNLFGIYGSANTRIGLNYGITDKIMVGVGTTKDYKLQDLQWKYRILTQKADNSMPISLSYYGNAVIDARPDDAFGDPSTYKFIHRFSYFTQLIVARKINDMFSVQVAPSLAYFNAVPRYSDTTGYKNLNFGIHAGARANLFGNHSLMLEYDQLLTKQELSGTQELEDKAPKPNLTLGWEISTATHCFQVFVANYQNINNQYNLLYSTNDLTKGEFLFGFNITVRF